MSSDECEEICLTLPDTNATKNEDILPAKSRERYIVTYENFITWQKEKDTRSFSEDVLMAYFKELATKYKPSSLWAIYSMLKLGLKSNHGVKIKKYVKLHAFLKKQSIGYVCKKAKMLTIENVEKFIDEAPDDKYLATKVALILAVTGGLRQQDLSEITTNDIENNGKAFLIKVPHTKNRIGPFIIQGKYYNVVKKYQSLRSERKGGSTRFFQQFRNGKCRALVIGKNRFGMMPREIAEFLNLPDAKEYTGHSFRKASTTSSEVEERRKPREEADDDVKTQEASKLNITEEYIDEIVNVSIVACCAKIEKFDIEDSRKLFIRVPDDIGMRNVWLEVSGRDPTKLYKIVLYLCGDHFDLEQDMQNYIQFKDNGISKTELNETSNHLSSKSNTEAEDPLENLETVADEVVQCRFCGEFSHDCVAVSGHMPYIAGHKTTLAINHIRIELDFSNDSLPTTVCRHCHTKLLEICEFVKQVNTAQFSLVTVSQKVNNQIVKAEFHENDDIDALTITEEEYVKNTTIKRKSDDKGKTSKKKAKTIVETEFIIHMDIKEEIIDDVKRRSPEYSDTEETDVKPSESELANSALVYRMSETSDRCNLTKSSRNSEIGNSALVYQMSETPGDRCNLTNSSRNSERGNSVIDRGLID